MSAKQHTPACNASRLTEGHDNRTQALPEAGILKPQAANAAPVAVLETVNATAQPSKKTHPRSGDSAEQRAEYAYLPAFVVMLVIAGAERYLAACLLTQAANKGSWLAIEAYVFLFDRQPTFMSIVLGFDIQEVNPVGSPLTFLRAILQLVHFGLHWLLAFYCFRWCYRLSRLAGHAASAVAAILMVALWFIVLPALGANLPGPRKAEKEPPRKVSRPFD
jgi:hypothetical protein